MANLNFSLSHPYAGSFLSGFNPNPTALGLSGTGGDPLLSLIYAVIRGFAVRVFYAAYVTHMYCKAHSTEVVMFFGRLGGRVAMLFWLCSVCRWVRC